MTDAAPEVPAVDTEAPNYCPVCLTNSPEALSLGTCGHVCCDPCLWRLTTRTAASCPICRSPVFWAVLWGAPVAVVPVCKTPSQDIFTELMKPCAAKLVEVHRTVAPLVNFCWTASEPLSFLLDPTAAEFVKYLCGLAHQEPATVACWMSQVFEVCRYLDEAVAADWVSALFEVLEAAPTSTEVATALTFLVNTLDVVSRGVEVEAAPHFRRLLAVWERFPGKAISKLMLELARYLDLSHCAIDRVLACAGAGNRSLFKALRCFPLDAWNPVAVQAVFELCTMYVREPTDPKPALKMFMRFVDVPEARDLLSEWFLGAFKDGTFWGFDRAPRKLALFVLEALAHRVDRTEVWAIVVAWLVRALEQDSAYFGPLIKYKALLNRLFALPTPSLMGVLDTEGCLARLAKPLAAHVRRKFSVSMLDCVNAVLDLGIRADVLEVFGGLGLEVVRLTTHCERLGDFDLIMCVAQKLASVATFRQELFAHWKQLFSPLSGNSRSEFAYENAHCISLTLRALLAHEHGEKHAVTLCVSTVTCLSERCFKPVGNSSLAPSPSSLHDAVAAAVFACFNAGVPEVDKELLNITKVLLSDILKDRLWDRTPLSAPVLNLFDAVKTFVPLHAKWLYEHGDGLSFLRQLLTRNTSDDWCQIAVAMFVIPSSEWDDPTSFLEDTEEWIFTPPVAHFWGYLSRVLSRESGCSVAQLVDVATFLGDFVRGYDKHPETISVFGQLWDAFCVWMPFKEATETLACAMAAGLRRGVPGVRVKVPIVLTAISAFSLCEFCVHRCVELLNVWTETHGVDAAQQAEIGRVVWKATQGLPASKALTACFRALGPSFEAPSAGPVTEAEEQEAGAPRDPDATGGEEEDIPAAGAPPARKRARQDGPSEDGSDD